MADQPSYKTSFLSQLALGACAFYALFLTIVTCGVIWAGLAFETGDKLVAWATVP